ncbi:hypothetical protein MRX96_022783 [Rhipicephalus microplus]
MARERWRTSSALACPFPSRGVRSRVHEERAGAISEWVGWKRSPENVPAASSGSSSGSSALTVVVHPEALLSAVKDRSETLLVKKTCLTVTVVRLCMPRLLLDNVLQVLVMVSERRKMPTWGEIPTVAIDL